MLYKFKSPATGDLIMLGPQGDQLLLLLGRDPAPKGIIEPADMPAAAAALEAAMAQAAAVADDGDEEPGKSAVGLKQRLWPLLDMLRRCQAAGEPIVWGV